MNDCRPDMPPPLTTRLTDLAHRLSAFLFGKRRSIRWHIITLFSLTTSMVFLLAGTVIYLSVYRVMRDNMMEKLAATNRSVEELVASATQLAIRDHLQTMARTDIGMLRIFEEQVAAGVMTREAAKRQAANIVLQQRIGEHGYVYVVNSQGIVQVHPEPDLFQADLSSQALIRQQIAMKNGLIDYTWKAPEEQQLQAKTMAMAHFEPWDWIVSVTCPKNELNFLANELRYVLENHHFGRTGYAFIVNGQGDIILHPWLKGNVHALGNQDALEVVNRILRQKNGQFEYLWQEKNQVERRRKIVFFHTIPELDWTVASTVQSEEILEPLHNLGWMIGAIVIGALLMMSLLGRYLGNRIIHPLALLTRQMERVEAGDLNVLAEEEALGEIGRLGHHFNSYLSQLRKSNLKVMAEFKERIAAEEQLLIYRNAMEQALEGIVITDPHSAILVVNKAFSEITQYAAEEVLHRNIRLLQSGRHDRTYYREMWQTLAQTGRWIGEVWNRRKNGEIYPQILGISAVRDANGLVTNFVGLFHDITDLKLKEERIVHQAYHDSLTGLPNRRLAMDRTEVSIAHVRRGGTKLAVLMLDLDNFKNVNDTLGHASGDTLLQLVTNRLVAQVREEDTVARLGGDEFLLLVAAITSEQVVIDLVQRLLKNLAVPFRVDDQDLFITASIGVSLFPNDGANAATLIKYADIAMYEAKARGKNSFCLFTPDLGERISFLRQLESNLRQAVTNNEFTVYFQPKIDPFSATVVGGEALVRWQRSDGTLVSPADFIPLAEETGLIVPLGEQVLEQTCQLVRRLNAAGQQNLTLSVNLSPLQFVQADLVTQTLSILHKYQVAPDQIELEVTETAMMSNLAKAVETLNALVAAGLSIAIDDFGTGYSSLSYLKRFPIRTLKIDRSFIRDMIDDHNDAQLVETIILMAHNLGIIVVAEGVETEPQLAWLKSRGCEQIQGFLYSRPLPAEGFIEFINRFPESGGT